MDDKTTFEDLGISNWITSLARGVGISHPTPVQAACIPEILKGRDVIASSKTGTGKTLAFAMPIIEKLLNNPFGVFALILTPTRELAIQIAEHFVPIGKPSLRHLVIIGGECMVKQGHLLDQKPHVVIATPGRLADRLDSDPILKINFKRLRFLVLDEADRLLDGSFKEQLDIIFQQLPTNKRQNLLFSATIKDSIENLKALTNDQVFLYEGIQEVVVTPDLLQQRYVFAYQDFRTSYLVQIFRTFSSSNSGALIIVFTNSCKKCYVLSKVLNELGFSNVSLHSLMKQKERVAALNRFRSSHVKILIATDVASRGLDLPLVKLVVNHNVPADPNDYIHRVGRTARANRDGLAITMISSEWDTKALHKIEDCINFKLTKYEIDEEEIPDFSVQIASLEVKAEIQFDREESNERKIDNLIKKRIQDDLNPDKEIKKKLKYTNHKSRNKSNSKIEKTEDDLKNKPSRSKEPKL